MLNDYQELIFEQAKNAKTYLAGKRKTASKGQ